MFYGSGAGKLPTASAVVADIVDIVKHRGRNILISWSSKKMELLDYKKTSNRFFLRIKGEEGERLPQLTEVFGALETVKVPEISGEFGIVTGSLEEGAFADLCSKTDGILQTIRLA
jgi:homoserine dehydrogenase